MDSLNLLARLFRLLLAASRAARIGPAASMSDAEVAGNAHGISYAMLATRWQRKNNVPSWASVYEQWQTGLPAAGAISPALYGSFDPSDKLELITGNAAAFEKREELYRAAKKSIDISTFYIQADEVGWKTARSLAECARRGVRVRIVADRCITERKAFENPQVLDVIRFLRDAGADYRLFKDPGRPYDACHRKLLIVDDATLITGGRNYADHYAGTEWRDIDLLLTGPSVASLRPIFERTFSSVPTLHESVGNIFQATAPAGIASNASFVYLLGCIRGCRKTLDIENAYYFNHPAIHRELADACRRGVRVRLFTNSAQSNDLDYMNYRLYAGFQDLIEAGVSLYLRRGKGRTLHCKYFVADGEWAGFGSSNLDFFSPRFCHELGIQVRDARLGELLSEWFDHGIAEAELIRDRASIESVMAEQAIGKIFDRWLPDIQ